MSEESKTPKICPTCGLDKNRFLFCGCETNVIWQVDIPQEGSDEQGIWSWFEGRRYPYPGLVAAQVVKINDIFKRSVISSLRNFPFLVLFPSRAIRYFNDLAEVSFRWLYGFAELEMKTINHLPEQTIKRIFDEHGLRVQCWSPQVRALWDAIGDFLPWDLKNGLCMLLDFDNAYKFRYQEFVNQLDLENFKKSPKRELLRALKVCLSRERATGDTNDLRKKWRLAMLGASALMLFPKYKRLVVSILSGLDLDKARPSELDKYWMYERWDYDFDGLPYDERIALRKAWDIGYEQELYREHAMPSPAVAIMGNLPFRMLSTEKAKEVLEHAKNEYMANAWPKYRIQDKQKAAV